MLFKEEKMSAEKLILNKLNNIEDLLKNRIDEVLNFERACKHLDLSPSYLYKLTSAHLIPHYKPSGKRLYFSKAELNAWLMRNPRKVIPETKEGDNRLSN